jgi:peptidyl-dipeptidase Dcp
LYWVEMKKIDFKWTYDENVEFYEVYKDWKFISYFIWDYFYNPNKRSWAWADELRSKFENKKAIVVNVMNFVKAKSWKTLLTLWEVETLFHEFGHALHAMLSKSKYSDLSGFWVEWDFVELPSQLMEKWASDDLTIKNVTKHYKTWENLSDDLFESLKRLNTFWTWNFVLWQNTYSVIDMMFHSWKDFKDIEDLDKKFLEKVNELSIFKKEENYKMYCSFSHIFAWWYSAWYYSYIWADIIVDDIWNKFKKNWVFDKKTADNFEKKILWAGSIKKASEMFEDFMGRKVSIEAFLREKGLK